MESFHHIAREGSIGAHKARLGGRNKNKKTGHRSPRSPAFCQLILKLCRNEEPASPTR